MAAPYFNTDHASDRNCSPPRALLRARSGPAPKEIRDGFAEGLNTTRPPAFVRPNLSAAEGSLKAAQEEAAVGGATMPVVSRSHPVATKTGLVDVPVAGLIDPQLDTNILSALANPRDAGHVAATAYATANRAAGLSVNRSVYMEFLERFSKYQFEGLRAQYGIALRREFALQELEATARRLQGAFAGTARTISLKDARAAASVFLTGERFGTADLQFFKRAQDLGLNVDFVGTGNAARSAAAYVPQRVVIK